MKLLKFFVAVLGLFLTISAQSVFAAFVPVGPQFSINNGSAPGGFLNVGNVRFSDFQVVITGTVPTLPSSLLVQAGTDGSQYGLQFNLQNFLVMPNQFLNATLSFRIDVLPPFSPMIGVNGAEMTLTGVSFANNGLVTIGESLRPTTGSAPVANLSVFAGTGIPVSLQHDEKSFAQQTTLFVRKDILLVGGDPAPIGFSAAHLSEFFQLYDVVAIPEPSTTGLAILGTIGVGWIIRRRKTPLPQV